MIRFSIRDLRAVNEADIDILGISVISGLNGSGKSTISQFIYTSMKTAIEYNQIVDKQFNLNFKRDFEFIYLIFKEIQSIISPNRVVRLLSLFNVTILGDFVYEFIADKNKAIEILNELIKATEGLDLREISLDNQSRIDRLVKYFNVQYNFPETNNNLSFSNILSRYRAMIVVKFNEVDIKKHERPVEVLFQELQRVFPERMLDKNFKIIEYNTTIYGPGSSSFLNVISLKDVIYIDTPMAIGVKNCENKLNWQDLNQKLQREPTNIHYSHIEAFNSEVLGGNFDFDSDSNEPFKYKRFDGKEFDLLSCATGLKAFSILSILYKSGSLNQNTLLIIDEPEAHLHPQWVVEYARLIVIMNRDLGVKFLIASHHPEMISAIRYISEKEGVLNSTLFYIAEDKNKDSQFTYKLLGKDIHEIFDSFNQSFYKIDKYGVNES